MKRNSNLPEFRYISLCLVIVLVFSGCGKLSKRAQKLEQKVRAKIEDRQPGHLHSVTISWTASTSAVIGYNVYRANSYGYPIEKLTPQPIAATQFTDATAVGGVNYTYYATSVDARRIESQPSNVTTASIPYP